MKIKMISKTGNSGVMSVRHQSDKNNCWYNMPIKTGLR